MTASTTFRILGTGVILALAGCGSAVPPADHVPGANVAGAATVELRTDHYSIGSTAEGGSTVEAGRAVEALFEAYVGFFGDKATGSRSSPLRIRLYSDRTEFQANNRSRPWAEAYYVDGVCHAYWDPAKPNPHHWLLHEAVHQLNRELMGLAQPKWINEGLATYFGSSRFVEGQLEVGVPDAAAYPVLWLKRWELTGNWAADVESQRIIPLRKLITGEGEPSLDASVNAHYLGWWSLTHFLLHYDGGRYEADYRQLMASDGSLAKFEQVIGPVESVEAEWYRYFVELAGTAREGGFKQTQSSAR